MEALTAERLTWQTAHWANGPKVAEWVEAQRFGIDGKCSHARQMCRWRTGGQASIYTIDRLLSHYARHVSELPDDVWEPQVPYVTHTFTPKPCRRCGKEIPRPLIHGKPEHPSRYKERSYCSKECRAAPTEGRKCKHCGNGFVFVLSLEQKRDRSGGFCSRDCARAAGRDAQRAKRKANWKSNVGRQAA